MFTLFRKSFKALNVKSTPPVEASVTPALQASTPVQAVEFDIAPNDPLLAYFMSTAGLVEIDKLEMDSPALHSLKAAGVKISVPLVSQGELIGLLNLGGRRSEQEYSVDDRRFVFAAGCL